MSFEALFFKILISCGSRPLNASINSLPLSHFLDLGFSRKNKHISNQMNRFSNHAALGFGIWMSTHHDGCRRSLTLPIDNRVLGAFKDNSILLYTYLIMWRLHLGGNFCVHNTSGQWYK